MADPEVIHASVLGEVPHGFLGRRGGVSGGLVAGLNLGMVHLQEFDNVRVNRACAAEAVLPGAGLALAVQTHSADVVIVTEPCCEDRSPRADALVTTTPNLLLGIVTADCAPVLFVDHEAQVIGAAHAGWRGAHGGVCENTIAVMESLGARREAIAAAIGPAIAQPSYEVAADFRENFTKEDSRFFAPGRPDHFQFDLPAYIAARLQAAGIGLVQDLALDTYPDETRFFSHRRATHRGEVNCGRQVSLIGLRA